MSSISYDLKKIKAIALDVDGVLSTAMLTISADGEPLRMLNVKDGYALQLAVKRGYRIAVISGGSSEGVKSPATVTTLPEKQSVPLLRKKPRAFTLIICSFVSILFTSLKLT